jgi:hypothetical protein
MRSLLVLIGALMVAGALPAQETNAIRGGWVAEVDGRTQVYLLIVRGAEVTGTHCFDCADPDNLGFIAGRVDSAGVHFVIRHEYTAGNVTVDDARGVLKDQELILTLQPRGGAAHPQLLALHRPVPLPNAQPPAPAPAGAARPRAEYVAPGPAQPLSADQLLGLWLWGAGPGKQYFIIRHVGTQLLGMVCGPCDDPNAMAPLDGFAIDGTALTFNIVHEDTGGAAEHGPFNNVAHATLARNELHLKVIASYAPPDSTPFEMTLLGPVTWRP